jgi:hypothetical protein
MKADPLKVLLTQIQAGTFNRWSVKGMPLTQPQKSFVVRAYDGNLDAALCLQESLAPEWEMDAMWLTPHCEPNPGTWQVRLRHATHKHHCVGGGDWEGNATPSRAWLVSIFKAKIAETEHEQ